MEPIAIIGIGCRFPGAKSPDAYWQLLRNGVDAIREVPAERWNIDDFYDPDPSAPGKMNTRHGGFIDDVDQFDPYFFGITPREAMSMDPQQRLLLEVAWEALEDAGQVLEDLANTQVGVFVGISSNDYSLQVRDPRLIDPHMGTGNLFSIAAGRISYLLNLRGPSLAVDTACSSSLLSVHLACQSLMRGESTLALAGGVNLILVPGSTITLSKLSALSPDGRCKTFDASANGYVRGEGAGMVVLKPLAQALADGDPIYAVIRGSAVNHDGRSNGLTAPNGPSQEALIRQALADAGATPAQVGYIEAHGTGTPLGDPIEVMALGSVLADGRDADAPCILGSVKTNIGHLEAAAGIASVIKVALSLKHGEIPPSLHFNDPNPYIPFDQLPVRVQRNLGPWPRKGNATLAGISSFGFSGTNAHLILEGAPEDAPQTPMGTFDTGDQAQVLALSARSEEALQSLAHGYRDRLVMGGPMATPLREMCYTAALRRTHHDHRLSIVFNSWDELVDQLGVYLRGEEQAGLSAGRKHLNRRPKVAFVFSGQGPQWWGMGRELLQREPRCRAVIEQIDGMLQEAGAQWSLLDEMNASEADSRLDETEIAQPAIFALQVALVELWRSWGIAPGAVVGHSMGEVTAAYVAGGLSLADAVRVIYHRARVMQRATGLGKMASVELTPAEVNSHLSNSGEYSDRLWVAAINGPSSTVVAGDPQALDEFVAYLEERQVFVRSLPVNYAFHTPQMEPFLGELATALQGVQNGRAALPYASTVTGELLNGTDLDVGYWQRNVREPVRFAEAIDALIDKKYDIFLEVGPHPVLSSSITQCLHEREKSGTVLASLRRNENARVSLLGALGALYTRGYPVDWAALYPEGGHCIALPSYPWQRDRYWLQLPDGFDPLQNWTQEGTASPDDFSNHPLLGSELPGLAHQPDMHTWQSSLRADVPAFLTDHRVLGMVVVPAAAYAEMALSAAATLGEANPVLLRDLVLSEALLLSENGMRTVQCALTPDGESASDTYRLHIHSSAAQEEQRPVWASHAQGTVSLAADGAPAAVDLAEIRARCTDEVPVTTYYETLWARGLEYGPSFQGIQALQRCDGEALGRIELPEALHTEAALYQAHPALLDACLQVVGASVPADSSLATAGDVYIPTGMEEMHLYRPLPARLWSHAVLRATAGKATSEATDESTESAPDAFLADLQLLNEAGETVAEIAGFRLQRLARGVKEALQGRQRQAAQRATPTNGTVEPAAAPAQKASPSSTNGSGRSVGGVTRRKVLAATPEERVALLSEHLGQQLAKAMKVPVSKLDFQKPLEEQGFDSLMAIEVKYAVESELAIEIPVRNLIDKPTVESLATQLNQLLPAEDVTAVS